MIPIVFALLSSAVCTFLLYALAQFRRESVQVRRRLARGARLTQPEVCRIEAALQTARKLSHAGDGQRTNDEAVMRKEALAGAVVGLAALLAPFIFVMLLHSPWRR